MHIVLGYLEGCPNWETALVNLEVAASRIGADIEVDLRRAETAEDAERLGLAGSPTLLLEGADPFAVAEPASGLACRLYATPAGLAGAPTVDQLVAVLSAHEQGP